MRFDPSDPFQRCRHARYFEPGVVYHVVFRTIQGLFLLNPDAHGRLRRIAAGVFARARETFPTIKNYGASLLSNHAHLVISGSVEELAAYVGFIKRELSRRWGPLIGWRGIFEDGYHATALITPEAQIRCLKYVLAQSVKEGLVAHPYDWPGLHCAKALVTGTPIEGEWFDGTAYSTAFHRAKRRGKEAEVKRQDFIRRCHFSFDKLPALAHLDDAAYGQAIAELIDEIIAERRSDPSAPRALGAARVLSMSRLENRSVPKVPWTERRRLVCWDDRRAPEVASYLDRYWRFQIAFRLAADEWRQGIQTPAFPAGAFWPGRASPVPPPALGDRMTA